MPLFSAHVKIVLILPVSRQSYEFRLIDGFPCIIVQKPSIFVLREALHNSLTEHLCSPNQWIKCLLIDCYWQLGTLTCPLSGFPWLPTQTF